MGGADGVNYTVVLSQSTDNWTCNHDVVTAAFLPAVLMPRSGALLYLFAA